MTLKARLNSLNENALAAHVISVASVGLASLLVYLIFRLCELLVEWMSGGLPLDEPGPANLLRLALSWGGAITAGATALIASYFEVRTLLRRLQRTQGQQ